MKAPILVAVSGGSGSGKTTFVRSVADLLQEYRPLLLSTDHYYRDLSDMDLAARSRQNFDHPDALELSLLNKHLFSLRQGEAIERPCYDFPTHTRIAQTLRLEASPVIILDGIFALCFSELLPLFDLKLYIDVDSDIRVIRRISRDLTERGRSFESATKQYLRTVKPMHERFVEPSKLHADFVIPWQESNPTAVRFTARMIEEKLTTSAQLSVSSTPSKNHLGSSRVGERPSEFFTKAKKHSLFRQAPLI